MVILISSENHIQEAVVKLTLFLFDIYVPLDSLLSKNSPLINPLHREILFL